MVNGHIGLKKSLGRDILNQRYPKDCCAARTNEGVDHAHLLLKLEDWVKTAHIHCTNLIADVNKMLKQCAKDLSRKLQENNARGH